MKKLLLVLSLGIVLVASGCSDARGRASVMLKFPGCDIAQVPDTSGYWIIRKPDGSIWYANCDGFAASASANTVFDVVEIIPAFPR